MATPKVFISYSHDSLEHKQWVLNFALGLRNAGVDATLDQWDIQAGDDLPAFMERNLSSADRVLMICTSKYVEKANNGTGGVGYEKMIVTADLMNGIDSNKVIPIIRQNGTRDVPTFLKTKLFIDLSMPERFDFGFEEVLRTIHGAPLFVKPPIGNNPYVPTTKIAEPIGDGLRDIMSCIVYVFESQSQKNIRYSDILRRANTSRIMVDVYIDEALELNLIMRDRVYQDSFNLTDLGRKYAIDHKLI